MKLLPTPSSAFAIALGLLVQAHQHSSGAVHALAQRNVRCDDLEPLTCKVEDNLQKQFPCKDGEILARQIGCFACVDEATCLRKSYVRDSKAAKANAADPAKVAMPTLNAADAVSPKKVVTRANAGAQTHAAITVKEAAATKASTSVKVAVVAPTNAAAAAKSSPPAAWIRAAPSSEPLAAIAETQKKKNITVADERTRVSELSLPFMPDALSVAESAQFNGVDVSAGPEAVSSWLFLAPAMIVLVSIGIAVRSRILHKRGETFKRVADRDRDDEINPFCDSVQNPQDDDEAGGVEFAPRFTVTSDDDDDSGHENPGHERHEGGPLGSLEALDSQEAGGEAADEDTATDDGGFAIVVSTS
ncbi:hypothetical protein PybrP1_007961 [[Pythium] brassicae (nom. inval.)]|nr:hypothetical protein PybrP1_007961 [[Pythium] brassicae (nom. inval.)]